jgi:hypothetical protein
MTKTLSLSGYSGDLRFLVDDVCETAKAIGVPITPLGVQALFDETRLYQGTDSDWALAPAEDDAHLKAGPLPIPRRQLAQLKRLPESGLNFPAVFVAHEIPKGAATPSALPARRTSTAIDVARGFRSITPRAAQELVGPPPLPARPVRRSKQLGSAATEVFKLMGQSLPVMAGLAVGAALAPLALVSVFESDPIVFGAVPLYDSLAPGTPAVFFELVRWTW